jgi:hypothetical protein
MKKNRKPLSLIVTSFSIALGIMTILFVQNEGYSNEPESSLPDSMQDCTQGIEAEADQPVVEASQASNNAPQQDEMLSDAEIAAIPDSVFDTIDRLNDSQSNLVEEVYVVRTIENEVILESAAVEIVTTTSDGIVSCDITDNFLDTVVKPGDELIFLGGPLDNQSVE